MDDPNPIIDQTGLDAPGDNDYFDFLVDDPNPIMDLTGQDASGDNDTMS